jgi:hypothetical protein
LGRMAVEAHGLDDGRGSAEGCSGCRFGS